jgi:hypothetical protein
MALIFPKWTNEIPKVAPPILGLAGAFAVFAVWYWFSPWHTDVGYKPVQPIPYSHKLHAGNLGMDCRYCHNNVEESKHAGVPPTSTCMNCHAYVRTDSPLLAPLRKSWTDGTPIPWVRIHKSPDYAYFDHSAHLNIAGRQVGVGCKSCHGRIDQMVEVLQVEPLSMGWCLDCHRQVREGRDNGFPVEQVLRPRNRATDMTWEPDAEWAVHAKTIAKGLKPPTVECSGCHR